MILTCPSCTTRYLVAEGAIGARGRTVRCAQCGHQWFQEPELGLDDILFGQDADEDVSMLESDFSYDRGDDIEDDQNFPVNTAGDQPMGDFQSILKKEMAETAIPQGVRPDLSSPVLPPDVKTGRGFKIGQTTAGLLAAGLLFVIMVGLFFALHRPIAALWPASQLFYQAVGFELPMIGEGLILEDITVTQGENTLILKGDVINLTDTQKTIPPILARVVDAQDQTVAEIRIPVSEDQIEAEAQIGFSAIIDPAPADAANVSVGFSRLEN